MKFKILFSAFVIMMMTGTILSQDKLAVNGIITDTSDKVLADASVKIIAYGSEKVVSETKSDSKGSFRVEIPKGDYQFVIRKEGYQVISESVKIMQPTNLGKFKLKQIKK